MQILRTDDLSFTFWRDQIENLFNQSVRINFPGFDIDDDYGAKRCEEVLKYLKDGTAIVYIATEHEKLMGWVWCHQFYRLGRKRLHIAEIAVSDDCYRKGIGSRLLNKVELYARENGYSEIDLLVTAANEAAVKFYERASFLPERILMKKSLAFEAAADEEEN